MSYLSVLKKLNKNTLLVGIAVVGILITGVLIYADNTGFKLPSILGGGMSSEKIANNVIDYINNNQLSGSTASLVSFSEESGLVKVKIKIGENEFDSYATRDGKYLFPQAFGMNKNDANGNANAGGNSNTPTEVVKNDKPLLEGYVVSRCPFGIQIQRAMADAVKNMPALAPYIKVRYIGAVSSDGNSITAMHGDAEAKENLRQICIRDEQPAKYWNYVACQTKSGDTAGCEKSTGVDSAKLNACIADPKRGVAFAKQDFDLSQKYRAFGSPTMILNEAEVSESGYGGRSSDGIKSMVCAGFNTEANFCKTKLNTAEAATSFSEAYERAGGSGSGNSGATGANCAPAQ